ncbi:hypothetical protein PanWU01x14_094760, partial [Parasponia andersonii]
AVGLVSLSMWFDFWNMPEASLDIKASVCYLGSVRDLNRCLQAGLFLVFHLSWSKENG